MTPERGPHVDVGGGTRESVKVCSSGGGTKEPSSTGTREVSREGRGRGPGAGVKSGTRTIGDARALPKTRRGLRLL